MINEFFSNIEKPLSPWDYQKYLIGKYCGEDTDPYRETVINTAFILYEIDVLSRTNKLSLKERQVFFLRFEQEEDEISMKLKPNVLKGCCLICNENIEILEDRVNDSLLRLDYLVDASCQNELSQLIHFGRKRLGEQSLEDGYLPYVGKDSMYRNTYNMKIQEAQIPLYNRAKVSFTRLSCILGGSFVSSDLNDIDDAITIISGLVGINSLEIVNIFYTIKEFYDMD